MVREGISDDSDVSQNVLMCHNLVNRINSWYMVAFVSFIFNGHSVMIE